MKTALILGLVMVGCGTPTSGGADSGRIDGAPGADANTQPPGATTHQCDYEQTRTTNLADGSTTVFTFRWARFDAHPAEVGNIQVCGAPQQIETCPDGATCTGSLILAETPCRAGLATFSASEAFVQCGFFAESRDPQGAVTSTTESRATEVLVYQQ